MLSVIHKHTVADHEDKNYAFDWSSARGRCSDVIWYDGWDGVEFSGHSLAARVNQFLLLTSLMCYPSAGRFPVPFLTKIFKLDELVDNSELIKFLTASELRDMMFIYREFFKSH